MTTPKTAAEQVIEREQKRRAKPKVAWHKRHRWDWDGSAVNHALASVAVAATSVAGWATVHPATFGAYSPKVAAVSGFVGLLLSFLTGNIKRTNQVSATVETDDPTQPKSTP